MSRAALALALALAACARPAARYPLAGPMWQDTDVTPVNVACRPDPDKRKPGHRLCRPREYESSFAGDGFDNLLTRPVAETLSVKLDHEAVNVNSVDEVPDSSWFQNRIGRHAMTPEEVRVGPCDLGPLPVDGPDGSWIIDQGKMNGANPGFRVTLAGGRRFMLKGDLPESPERATGATAVATRIYHAAGWWTACDSIVYVRRSLFSLKPGLTVTDNSGVTRPFDRAALDRLLDNAGHRGDLVRLASSEWLPGRTIGPFRYEGTRDDDPNDVIPHDDRRDLRGARLIAAWLNHFDAREQNTMTVWLADKPGDPDASPGHVRHYYLDLGDCFGSQWAWDGISRRLGHAYYLDFRYVVADLFTFGFIVRPWDRARISTEAPLFGYYRAEGFEPAAWKAGYGNPAFSSMTEHDGAWAARIIARFTDEQLAAAVSAGDFSEPRHREYLVRTLAARRDAILERYFRDLSPVTDVEVQGDELCAVDLARRSGLFPATAFRYGAAVEAGGARPALRIEDGGRLCLTLPRRAPDAGTPDDDASRYVVLSITNGQAGGRLRVHLYDLGPSRGHKLVGLQRL